MHTKKKFGQHILNEPEIAKRIVHSLSVFNKEKNADYKTVLEIGPGRGVLTQFLVDQPFDLVAVEIDPDMIVHLQQNLPALKKILSGDFLDLDIQKQFNEQVAIIGNFPYYISSQIVFRILENKEMIPEMVGMFQKEVAKRICGNPESGDYSVISVLTQAYYDAKYLFDVKPGSFFPPPKVVSGVVLLTRKKDFPNCDEKILRLVVKTSFNQRRKTLRNSLKAIISDHALLADHFFDKRPEQLNLNEFIALTNSLEPHLKHETQKSPDH